MSEKDGVERRDKRIMGGRKGIGWSRVGAYKNEEGRNRRKRSFVGLQQGFELYLCDLEEFNVGSLLLSRPQV